MRVEEREEERAGGDFFAPLPSGAHRPEFRPLDASAIPVDELGAAGREPDRPHSNSSQIFYENFPSHRRRFSRTCLAFSGGRCATENQKDKVSYSIGLDIGTTLKRQLIDVNPRAAEQRDSGRFEFR